MHREEPDGVAANKHIPPDTRDRDPQASHSDTGECDDAVIRRALNWSFAVVAVVGVMAAGLVYFNRSDEQTPAIAPEINDKARKREAAPVEVPPFRFTDVTEQAGISFVHENGAAGEKLLPETMGGGVAFFDYDNDGDPDLLFVNSQRWDHEPQTTDKPATLQLFENDGRGRFKNVTAGSGLDVSLYGMGVAVGDYDNDGRRDIYITALGRNRLFHNEGNGKFTEVTDNAGVAGSENAWSTSAGFFDYDLDGDLDLFVCNYLTWSREFDLGQNFTLDGSTRAYGQPQRFPGSFCYLFRNDGNGRFTDVSQSAGIQVTNSRGRPLGKSLGVSFADVNRDRYPDIVVANDTVQNFLFVNEGDGTFRETAREANIAYDTRGNPRGAMGIDAGYFRNDAQLGVAIGNFSNEMTALYVSRGGLMLFTDDAISNGIGPVTRQELTFGLCFFDADLDGRLDLFAANGHLERDIAKVQSRQSYEQPPQLLWNAGPGSSTEFLPVVAPSKPVRTPEETDADFEQRMEAYRKQRRDFMDRMGDFLRPMVGRGAAFADIDRDGDLDLVIVGNGQRARLLRNDGSFEHHWLQVKVKGTRSNRDAIGAWVEVHLPPFKPGTSTSAAAEPVILRQQVMPTRSYLSQGELPLTFGLGKRERITKIRIHWPSGAIREITGNIEVNSRITVTEPADDPRN